MKLFICILCLLFFVTIAALPAARLVKNRYFNVESDLNSIAGYIQIYDEDDYWERKGKPVCGGINEQTGSVICRDIGYNHSKVLSDKIFYRRSYIRRSWKIFCNGTERNVSECRLESGICNEGGSSLICSSDPINTKIQLEPFTRSFIPSIQIKMYNTNASVCSDGWDNNAAAVACRQAGYAFGRTAGFVEEPDFTPRLITRVKCTGRETNLNDCLFNETNLSRCQDSHHSASAFCSNEPIGDFEVSLAAGDHSQNEGIVQLKLQGVIGRVCVDISRRESVANWFCQRLGFLSGSYSYNIYEYEGSDLVWHGAIKSCTDLWNCTMKDFNTTADDCGGYKLRILCHTSITLMPGQHSPYVGNILQTVNGSSSLLCNDALDESSTRVACRQLGFNHGYKLNYAPYTTQTQYNLGNDHYQCTGTEMKLEDCRINSNNCRSQRPAFAMCSNVDENSGYKLYTEESFFGKASIVHQLVTGSICAEGWTDAEAQVFCRELNKSSIIGSFSYKLQTTVPEIKWLSGVRCRGNETKLSQCSNFKLGNISNCSLNQSAGVYCYKSTGDIGVVLMGGDAKLYGQVQVFIDDEFGGLCGKRFNNRAASVVCRMLNYTGGRAVYSGKFGRGSGHTYDADCHGNETSLKQCKLDLRTSYYGCRRDAAVVCYNDVRLTRQSDNHLHYGKLEVLHNGVWNSVCDSHFDSNLARRACRTLGYSDGVYRCCSSLGEDNSTSPVTIKGCHGNLTESGFVEGCDLENGCSSSGYVSLFCSKMLVNESALQVSLSSGMDNTFRLEANYFHGPVCGTGWSNKEANVLCRQYHHTGGIATFASNDAGLPIIFGGFNCTGNETDIFQCQRNPFNTGCSRKISHMGHVAAAFCYDGESVPRVIMYGHQRASMAIKIGNVNREICGLGWDDVNAGVVCREFGFQYGVVYETGSKFRASYRRPNPWRGIKCVGDETSLLMCPRQRSERISCITAGVTCFNERSIKLKEGLSVNSGTVVIDTDGIDEYICIDSFDQEDAEVVCRQLGYLYGIRGANKSTTFQTSPDQLNCMGNESSIFDCPTQTAFCSNRGYVATVICSNSSDVFNISLETYYDTTTQLMEVYNVTTVSYIGSNITTADQTMLESTSSGKTNQSSLNSSTTMWATQSETQSTSSAIPSTTSATQSTTWATQSTTSATQSTTWATQSTTSATQSTTSATQSTSLTTQSTSSATPSSPSTTQPVPTTATSAVRSTSKTNNPTFPDTTKAQTTTHTKASSDTQLVTGNKKSVKSTTPETTSTSPVEKLKTSDVVPLEVNDSSGSNSLIASFFVVTWGLSMSLIMNMYIGD